MRLLFHSIELDVAAQTMTSQTYGTKKISGSASSSYVNVKPSPSDPRFFRSVTAVRISSIFSASTFNALAAVLVSAPCSMIDAAVVIAF